jgi:hypothetical protein
MLLPTYVPKGLEQEQVEQIKSNVQGEIYIGFFFGIRKVVNLIIVNLSSSL